MFEFQGMNTEAKLSYLLKKQQLVNKAERMRMQDITQSYDIKQSQTFKKIKIVEDKLDTNPDYHLLFKP